MKNINMIPAIPGTVGAIMSRQPLELSPRMRAREALARLRQVGVPQDFMSSCYVVDEEGRLLGALTLYELVAAPDCARLDQAMSAPRAVLTPEYDQEEAVRLMEAADCVELPVVDDEGKLVGTVTAEDAMEVLRDEATEDMERDGRHPSFRAALSKNQRVGDLQKACAVAPAADGIGGLYRGHYYPL